MSAERAAVETEAAPKSPAPGSVPAVALQRAGPQWTRHLQRSLGNRAFGALLQRQTLSPPAGAIAAPADLPAQRTYSVVIVGSPGKAEVDANHAYQFAEAAAKTGGTSADTVWLVERTGYELGHVDLGGVTRRAGSAQVFWITPERPLAQLLAQFPARSVGSLHAFSHGLVGLLALRHGWSDTPDYGLSTEDARRLAPSVFTPGARISFDACNIGTGGDESLAQAIADAVQRPVEAWTGRTSYREFNRPEQYPNPEVRGSRIFPEGGGTDLKEFYSTVLAGREPQEFLFGPRSSPGDWTGRYRISARLPKTRTFPVAQGQSVTVRMNAYSDFRDAQGMKLTVQLHRLRTLFDDDIGPSHEVRVGGADTEFSWTGLDAGTYYLELWHLSGMTVEGDVSVRLGTPAGTLARSVREAAPPVLARAPLAGAPRRVLARSVEDDVQRWTTGLPRAARDGASPLTVTLHDAPKDRNASKTAPTLSGAEAGGALDRLTPAQAAVVASIAAARKAYEAAGKLQLYVYEGKVGWFYPGKLDDPTPTQITAPAAGVDPARTKAQAAVWQELVGEGGTGSINAYDTQYVTWGRGLGAKSGAMATAMDIALANATVRSEFLKVGIVREGGRWLVVNTRTGAVEQGDDAVFLMQGSKDILSAIAGVSELPAVRQAIADAQWAAIADKQKAGDVPEFAYGWDPRLIQFAAHMTHGGPAFGWTSTKLKAPGWTPQKPIYEKDTARDLYERSGGDAGKVLLAWGRARCGIPESPSGAYKITTQTVLTASWIRHMGQGIMADLLATKGSGPLDIPDAVIGADADLADHLVLKMPEGGYYVYPALSPAKEQALGPNVHREYLTRFDRMSMEAMLPEVEKLGRGLLPHYFSRDARIHAAPITNEQRLWWAKDVVLNRSVPKPPPNDGEFVPVHPDQVRAAYRYLKQPVPKQYQEGAALARRVLARAFVNSPEAIENYYKADGAAPDDAVLSKAKTAQAGVDKLMAQALALRTELDTAAKGGAVPDATKLAELGRLRREIMAALVALLPLLEQLQSARPTPAAAAAPAKKAAPTPEAVAEKLFGPEAADPKAAAQAHLTRLRRWEKRERIDALSREIAAADPAQRDGLVAQRKVLVDELRSTIRDIKQFSGPWATWDYLDAGGKTSWDYDTGQVSKIRTSACGPTTLAIILDFLAQGDPEGLLQPGKDLRGTELVKWAIDYAVAAGAHAVDAPTAAEKAKGDHGVASRGTSGAKVTQGLQAKLGAVKGEHIGADQARARQELAKGNLVICLAPGHFVLMDDFREGSGAGTGFHILEVGNVFGETGWTNDWATAREAKIKERDAEPDEEKKKKIKVKRAFVIQDMWVVSGGY